MSDLRISTDTIDEALAKTLAVSKRDPEAVMRETMRGVMRHVIGITPPAFISESASSWTVMQGGAAKRHGERLVKSDISSIYGKPRDAYDLIKVRDSAQAKAFWRHHKQGKNEDASAIARKVIGRGMYAFDGGTVHRRLKQGKARGRARSFLLFITDPKPLQEYIREIQARVGWLAAGWNDAAAALGLKPAQWIWRHPAPGAVVVDASAGGIRIVATNAVKYAGTMNDLERRVQYALDQQAGAMDRRFAEFMKQRFQQAGFAVVTS